MLRVIHSLGVRGKIYASLIVQDQRFPAADGREPQFICFVPEFVAGSLSQTLRVDETPQPNVRIEQQPQSRNTSQSSGSLAGEMISPRILLLPFIEPIQSRLFVGEGGPTSAMDARSELFESAAWFSALRQAGTGIWP